MSLNQLMFSLRIVSVDSYLSEPMPGLDPCYSEFRKNDVKSVPVFRVFGSTPAGQTTCLHLHGVFPYLMVPYHGPDVTEAHWTEIEIHLRQLALSIDSALNSASGSGKSLQQHVFKILLLRGIPFYGYHEKEELFLKIYYYKPGDIKRSADLLQAGAVMNRPFQPHEAHVPFILQLFIDYNLHGMNLLHSKNCWFRHPLGKPPPIDELPLIKRPDDDNEPKRSLGDAGTLKREKKSENPVPGGPSISQLAHFNWNLFREKISSSYSEKKQENDEDVDSPCVPGTSARSSHTNLRRISRSSSSHKSSPSCSALCQSLLSRTFSESVPQNSESMSSAKSTKCPLHTRWTCDNVESKFFLPTDVERHSTCDIEVDIIASDILNRNELVNSSTSNPGLASIWEDERARRRERGEHSQVMPDQSQIRMLGENLSNKEAHYVQMLYDALDKYKEENSSISLSFNDSLPSSTPASTDSRKRPSSDDLFASGSRSQSRRESQDLFTISPECNVQTTPSLDSSSDTIVPVVSQGAIRKVMNSPLTSGVQGRASDQETREDSFLTMLQRMEYLENEENLLSVASQHSSGPLDATNDAADLHTSLQGIASLSSSFSESQRIDVSSTQPIQTPDQADDEDDIETFEMSQRWDSAIQDLLVDLNESEKEMMQISDASDEGIPQLDGAADEPDQKMKTIEVGCCQDSDVSTDAQSSKTSCTILASSLATSTTSTVSSHGVPESTKKVFLSTKESNPVPSTSVPIGNFVTDVNMNKVKAGETISEGEHSSLSQVATSSMCCQGTGLKIQNLPQPCVIPGSENICKKKESPVKAVKSSSSSVDFKQEDVVKHILSPGVKTSQGIKAQKKMQRAKKKSDGCARTRPDSARYKRKKKPHHGADAAIGTSLTKVKIGMIDSGGTTGHQAADALPGTSRTSIKVGSSRPNVFTKILNENPGIMMYEKKHAEPTLYTHSAIINLDSLPASCVSVPQIRGMDGAIVEITTTPVPCRAPVRDKIMVLPPSAEEATTPCLPSDEVRKLVRIPEKRGKDEKPETVSSRTRRPRQASKSSYVDDPLYETVFDSDWASDEEEFQDDAYELSQTSRPRRTCNKMSFRDGQRRTRKKERIIYKWIIVNRFKGTTSMKVCLWKIPPLKKIRLTDSLLNLYDQYSPRKSNIDPALTPVSPPEIPSQKPRPMGKRSKHRLAILCPFGPLEDDLAPVEDGMDGILEGFEKFKNNENSLKEVTSNAVETLCFKDEEGYVEGSNISILRDSNDSESPGVSYSPKNEFALSLNDGEDQGVVSIPEKVPLKEDQVSDKSLAEKRAELLSKEEKIPSSSSELAEIKELPEKMKMENLCNTPTSVNAGLPDDKPQLVVLEDDAECDDISLADFIKLSKATRVSPVSQPETKCQSAHGKGKELEKEEDQHMKEDLSPSPAGNKFRGEEITSRVSSSDSSTCSLRNIVLKLSSCSDEEDLLAGIEDSKNPKNEGKSDDSNASIALRNDSLAHADSVIENFSINTSVQPGNTHPTTSKRPPVIIKPLSELCKALLSGGLVNKESFIFRAKEKPSKGKVVSGKIRKRPVKNKKDARKKKSSLKLGKSSRTIFNKYGKTKVQQQEEEKPPSRCIVPVCSRTVEPLWTQDDVKDVSAESTVERRPSDENNLFSKIAPYVESLSSSSAEPSLVPLSIGLAVDSASGEIVKRSLQKVRTSVKTVSTSKSTAASAKGRVNSGIARFSKSTTNSAAKVSKSVKFSSEKKSNTKPTSRKELGVKPKPVKRAYTPIRKVTRRSVSDKLNSIPAPDCMFNESNDDSREKQPPMNALLSIGYASPVPESTIGSVSPPRALSPMISKVVEEVDENDATDILEEFADSLGHDATKMLGIDAESVFKNMGCIDELIGDTSLEIVPIVGDIPDIEDHRNHVHDIIKDISDDKNHFDAILEDVSQSSDVPKALCKSANSNLADLEEETLMEFIDEMTSPSESQSSSFVSTLPITRTSPSAMSKPPIISPVHLPCEIPHVKPISGAPASCSNERMLHHSSSARPASSFPLMQHRQASFPPAMGPVHQRSSSVGYPNLAYNQYNRQGQQFSPAHIQSRSSSLDSQYYNLGEKYNQQHPSNSTPTLQQKSAERHPQYFTSLPMLKTLPSYNIGKDQDREQTPSNTYKSYESPHPPVYPLHNDDPHKKMGSQDQYNVQRGNHYGGFVPSKDQSCYYYDNRGDCTPTPPRPVSTYSQPPENYPYLGKKENLRKMPHPGSVAEPLQVFHTHVHHHHHVHSIQGREKEMRGPKMQERYPRKDVVPSHPVKTEFIKKESPWPGQSCAYASQPIPQAHRTSPFENNHSTLYKTRPSTYPLQTPSNIQVTKQSATVTSSQLWKSQCGHTDSNMQLNYCSVTQHQSQQHQIFSPLPTLSNIHRQPSSPVISVLLKGSCQTVGELYGISMMRNVPSKAVTKASSKSKSIKKCKAASKVSSFKTPNKSAKTPYGIMKQHSLQSSGKFAGEKPVSVSERKRKSIADFRAPPPDTPTISLARGSLGERSATESKKLEEELFNPSQDMFETPPTTRLNSSPKPDIYSAYNFSTESSEISSKKNADVELESGLAATNEIERKTLDTSVIMSASKFSKPIPKKGEEVVLNCFTGEWEIVKVRSPSKDEVPLVFQLQEQVLGSLYSLAEQNTEKEAKITESECSKIMKGDLKVKTAKQERLLRNEQKNIAKFRKHRNEKISNLKNWSLRQLEDRRKSQKVHGSGKDKCAVDAEKVHCRAEYMVAAVDLESNSPKLKLTLKKAAAPIRGKPQISCLARAVESRKEDVRSETRPTQGPIAKTVIALRNKGKTLNPVKSDTSDDSDFSPAIGISTKLKRKSAKALESDESDSDFRIDDVSSASSEDDDDNDYVEEDNDNLKKISFEKELEIIRTSYSRKARRTKRDEDFSKKDEDFLITLNIEHVKNALNALDENFKSPKTKNVSPHFRKRKSSPSISRSKKENDSKRTKGFEKDSKRSEVLENDPKRTKTLENYSYADFYDSTTTFYGEDLKPCTPPAPESLPDSCHGEKQTETVTDDGSECSVPPIKIIRLAKKLSMVTGDNMNEASVGTAFEISTDFRSLQRNTAFGTKFFISDVESTISHEDQNVIKEMMEEICDMVALHLEQVDSRKKNEKKSAGGNKTQNPSGSSNRSCGFQTESKPRSSSRKIHPGKRGGRGKNYPSPSGDPPPEDGNTGVHSEVPYLYRLVLKPPSPEEVLAYAKDMNLCTDAVSEPPYYSDPQDIQPTSHRLSSILPPYVTKPKSAKPSSVVPEYESTLSNEGSLHNWRMLLAASSSSRDENEAVRRDAAEILPSNVKIEDKLDAVAKIPDFPSLGKMFLKHLPEKVYFRPAVLPPSKEYVLQWLEERKMQKKRRQMKDVVSLDVKSELDEKKLQNMNNFAKVDDGSVDQNRVVVSKLDKHIYQKLSSTFNTETNDCSRGKPVLQRSISLTPSLLQTSGKHTPRRRVSFDLSNLSNVPLSPDNFDSSKNKQENNKMLEKLIENVSFQSPVSSRVPPSEELSQRELPFKYLASSNPFESPALDALDSSMPFELSFSVAPDGGTDGSSAIKTLVGSSETSKSSPQMFIISGSFTPESSIKSQGGGEKCHLDAAEIREELIPTRMQSTPNVSAERQQRKSALRKLAFTPITRANEDSTLEEESPSFTNHEAPEKADDFSARKISQPITTPSTSKGPSLRKIVLAKRFRKRSKDEDVGKIPGKNSDGNSPIHMKSDVDQDSPLSLKSPHITTRKEGSQIDGPTLDNTYGFKVEQQHLGEAKALHVVQHMTSLSIELHIRTRIDLRPDPDMDEIRALFYCLDNDSIDGTPGKISMLTGGIVVDPESASSMDSTLRADEPSTSAAAVSESKRNLLHKSGITEIQTVYVRDEMEMFLLFAQLVHEWDPDILIGYEVQMLSWGFLLQRAAHLRCDLCRAISRIPTDDKRNRHSAERDVHGADNASELHIVGRIVLNLWRLMRTELALYDYGFESVAYHLLHERYPKHDHQTLTNWFDPPTHSSKVESNIHRYRVVDYYICRVRANLRLLAQQDLIGRTSELARLFGMQFYEVLTRGTQFRVESMLLRTSRSHNLVAVTPSVLQRAQMRAPEVIALVMEPESKFYHVPVLVLDFQSLYPSIVIAYNLCYSTCLGRVEHLGSDSTFTFGCTSLTIPARTLNKLLQRNLITITPNGVAYVKQSVRRGMMPQMLDEILKTRIMVKNSMKKCGKTPEDAATKRMLDHRQLGLKLIANVTYGYTAANFSGRMPCVELGDSIVHKARETLERAINLVNSKSDLWHGARVVYGDTDSLFVALEGANNNGCSKERAFQIGYEIVATVTADNPTPIKLKFEKVYLPCILQTKKRYVGYSYETEDQIEPIFDAKGIETVRRDGTPATAKILERMIKILFDTRDVSRVKQYVLQQCTKILDGRSILQDCILAKEYRGKAYYKPGAVVPALNIAKKLLARDKRAEPRVGERVPYVIVHGAPGTPLYQLVRSPLEVLKDPSLKLNGAYYVTKQVLKNTVAHGPQPKPREGFRYCLLPALDRMMCLLGVDVFLWYRYLPRTVNFSDNHISDNQTTSMPTKKSTISHFFKSKHCLKCKKLSIKSLCEDCVSVNQRQSTAISLMMQSRMLERKQENIQKLCMRCTHTNTGSSIRCVSLDCPLLYKLHRSREEAARVCVLRKALEEENMF